MIIKSFASNKSPSLFGRRRVWDEVLAGTDTHKTPMNIEGKLPAFFFALPYNDLNPISPSP